MSQPDSNQNETSKMKKLLKTKSKEPVEKEFVRRGFDIEVSLYNRMRAAAAKNGQHTKDWLARAIRRQLKQVEAE